MKSKRFKRNAALLLVIVMVFTLSNPITSQAQANLTVEFQSGNAVISLIQQSQWDTGYITEIIIQNKGDQTACRMY